jgi:hypothetical protein
MQVFGAKRVVNDSIKRWGIGALAAAVFTFIGWKAAVLYERRGDRLPTAQAHKQQTTPKRDIYNPKAVYVPTADISANTLFSDYIPTSASSKPVEDDGIRLVSGFEGSPAAKITKDTDGHWVIEQEDPTWKKPHFFLFRIEGANGHDVTIELRNVPDRWSTINPVYSYTRSLDDLAAFALTLPTNAVALHKAQNGADLPDTSGQSWHFIEDTKAFNGSFWFRQKLDHDAHVCMRYPYTPSYNERYLDSLTNESSVSVITVGSSKEGRPLRVVKIGEGTEAGEQRKPCVLIYAREHADEQDSSWAAQGAIEFLVSDTTEARQIRKQCTFLVIPLLDPDGAAAPVYEHITDSFGEGYTTIESIAYSATFKAWVDRGKPLQLVLNLHNLESQEGPHVSNPRIESDAKRIKYSQAFYNEFVVPPIKAIDFRVGAPTESKGPSPGRLGDWLRVTYGTLHLPIELNSQERHRHMTISDLHQVGKLLVLSCTQYLNSEEAAPLLAGIEQVRNERAARWKKYAEVIVAKSAIEAERNCQWKEQSDRLYSEWGGRPPK